jgi:lipoprotein-releasing system ATP-binding protein
MSLIKAIKVEKSFGTLQILKGLDFEVYAGEAVCILGASGAGKSTFLHILGTLDKPTAGHVIWNGQDLSALDDEELSRLRNEKMGFVFQFHHLLQEFTALENVMLPGRIAGMNVVHCRARAGELLDLLGMSHRLAHYPAELSGGEQQRVTIARALFQRPQVLFADEPTGNLDTENSLRIQELFFDLKRQMNLTLIAVTHDQGFAMKFPRAVRMTDGHWVF